MSFSTVTYNTGIRKTPRNVAMSMPENTAMPITFRPSAPAPLASQQRHNAEDERERGHQDRPESQTGAFERGSDRILPLLAQHLGELHDQDRVLGGQPDQHDEPDLGEHIVHVALGVLARHPQSEVRTERGERRSQQHAERQAPALYCAASTRNTRKIGEPEDDERFGGALFLIRHVSPVVAHLRWQRLEGDALERIQRLRRAESRRGHAGDFCRAIEIESIGELGSVRGCRSNQRVERHHLLLVTAHEEEAELLGIGPIFGFRLDVHLVDAAETVEVVHVGAAEQRAERGVDVLQRHA